MFDIGFQELILLFGLGLMVLGPERLPRVVTQLGTWIGKARRMARSVSAQLRDELDVDLQSIADPDRPGPPPTYSRPGIDDLKPSTMNENDADDSGDSSATKDQSAHGQ